LSQQEEPSAGWAQHAPPLSSGFSLGVQQTEALFLGAQQEDTASSFFSTVTLLLVSTGISVCVSIVLMCFTFKDGDIRK
jgi:predicted PurR-regulated permease PerM